jgi:parvulin-like peptidyl-prolyl isomerase
MAALLCPAAAWAAPASPHAQPPRTLVDRVVAVVDADIITERELLAQAQGPLSEIGVSADEGVHDARRRRVLEQVLDGEISERLLNREVRANKDRLGVADKDVDRAIDEVMRLNHVNHEQLQAALYGQGLTWSEYRGKLRAQLERTRLVQLKVQGKVQVKEGEARRRCLERQRLGTPKGHEVVCASHILLRLDKDAGPQEVARQQKRAEALRARLQNGEPISELAKAHSDDPGAEDGALGCFGKGEMVEAFEAAAFALSVGETSDVVRTPFGLHLIVVTDKPAGQVHGCESAADLEPFKNEVYQEEMGRQMELWMQELKQAAFVEIRL